MKNLCLLLLFVILLLIPATSAYASKTLGDLNIGDKVVDNSWEWEHRTGNNYSGTGEIKPVTWIVVAKDHYGPGSGVTLLAEELIGRFRFDNSTHINSSGSNHWGDSSTIREQNIYITDDQNQVIPLLYYYLKTSPLAERQIHLQPVREYLPGRTYTLWIKDLKAEDGTVLKRNVKMDFTITN